MRSSARRNVAHEARDPDGDDYRREREVFDDWVLWWPENAAERRLDAYEAERIATDLPDGVTEEDQDLALVFGRDLSVHPESIRGRELREKRLRELGFDDVSPEQRAANLNDALDQFCDQ